MQFEDGFVEVLNESKLSKLQVKTQMASLFDPVTGTKQDRREKKRKINIAALFGKKPRHSNPNTSTPKEEDQAANTTIDSNLLSPPEEIETPPAIST